MSPVKPESDPLGGPDPMDEESVRRAAGAVARALGRLIVITGAVTTFLGIVAASCVPTMGSTRSARLQWRERQRQVEAAAHPAEGPREGR